MFECLEFKVMHLHIFIKLLAALVTCDRRNEQCFWYLYDFLLWPDQDAT